MRIDITTRIKSTPKAKRHKKIIELLDAIQPPRVSDCQINRYYSLKSKGNDLDISNPKGLPTPKFVTKQLTKERKQKLRGIKKDFTIVREKENKKRQAVLNKRAKSIDRDIFNKSADEKRKIFELVNKMISEPSENFHEQD